VAVNTAEFYPEPFPALRKSTIIWKNPLYHRPGVYACRRGIPGAKTLRKSLQQNPLERRTVLRWQGHPAHITQVRLEECTPQ
jgi:hypothetical protein